MLEVKKVFVCVDFEKFFVGGFYSGRGIMRCSVIFCKGGCKDRLSLGNLW